MRSISMKTHRRVLQVAVAVGWASSLQLSGCLNNPTRSDLAGEAEKAAILAETEIALQKVQQTSAEENANDASESENPESENPERGNVKRGNVVFAGGDQPETDSPILRVGGESEKQSRRSFWDFFRRKPSNPAVKDPFADTSESESQADASESESQSDAPETETPRRPASGKTAFASSTSPHDGVENPDSTKKSNESWFEREFAKKDRQQSTTSKYAPFEPTAQSKSGKSEDLHPAASEADNVFGSTSREFPTSGFKAVDSTAERQPATSDSDPWATQTPQENRTPNTQRADLRSLKPASDSPFKPDLRSTTPATGTLGSLEERQQRMRVQALLSEAHTNHIRGELHAAYRSALLAEKIVEEHHIQFDENEEDPHELAREIAALIWKTTGSTDPSMLAATEPAPQTPAAAVEANSASNSSNSKKTAFPSNSFARWEPLPADIHQPVKATSVPETSAKPFSEPNQMAAPLEQTSPWELAKQPVSSKPAQLSRKIEKAPEIMPEIRPWTPGGEKAEPKETVPLQVGGPEMALAAPQMPETPSQTTIDPASSGTSDSGVQFAIAHTVSEEQPPKLFDSFPSPGEENQNNRFNQSGRSDSNRKMASAMLETQRPKLMAPPVPMDEERLMPKDSSSTWEELAAVDETDGQGKTHSRASASAFRTKLFWSMLGLIGAGIATYLGIRISKLDRESYGRDYDDEVAPARPAAELRTSDSQILSNDETDSSDSDHTENRPLRIKRAA